MAYQVKKWKSARGLYYLFLEGGKRKVTMFIKDFLKEIDPKTLKAEDKTIKKRDNDKPSFIEGPNVTMVVMGNHIFIKPEKEDFIEIIKGMIELSKFK